MKVKGKSSRPRLLAATSDPDFRALLELAFTDEGFEALAVGSGREVVVQAMGLRPDIILLEAELPGMEAGEVVENLQRLRATKEIPILVLFNALELPDFLDRVARTDIHLRRKPVGLAPLKALITRLVGRRREADAAGAEGGEKVAEKA